MQVRYTREIVSFQYVEQQTFTYLRPKVDLVDDDVNSMLPDESPLNDKGKETDWSKERVFSMYVHASTRV